jgi:hypothetical protein
MDRAGQLIRRLKLPEGCLSTPFLALRVWPAAVGKRIAAHTRAVGFEHRRLVVEVADEVWHHQLTGLAPLILRNLERLLGEAQIERIDFRLAIPRRGPGREQKAPDTRRRAPGKTLLDAVPPLLDEADGIEDPVFRTLYRVSRKRSIA